MSLAPGQRLGPYEITAKLGEGGMAEVYRARDTKLNRDVAIKVLPDVFADDADRFARLTREAHTLAALNHPNIAQIYGLEEAPGVRALIMELVDGLTLQEVIDKGIPIDQTLAIARQIADALEAAHDLGIVHRDLKPANVKVRADGTVKVLDFGLAKGVGATQASPVMDAGSTVTSPAHTEKGMILGTAAYMAPEQARGQMVDKRADIWSFGVVLYEMLTGTRAFSGQGFTDVLASVLREDIDWSRLPADTPPRLRQLLERCLERDVKQRLRDIGEARIALASIARGGSGTSGDARAAIAQARPSRERLAWTVAVCGIAAATFGALRLMGVIGPTSTSVATDVVRLSVLPPPGLVINPDSANLAISPNGRMVTFVVGAGVSSENQLWVRSLDSPIARRIEGGDGVSLPFWSPDSARIGFFADRKLKTVAAAGGASEVVCEAPFGRGGTWNASNVILFAPDSTGPLYRVSANKGTPEVVTALDPARKETGHRFPIFLPDGDHFLYAALPGGDSTAEIFAGSLRDAHAKTFIGSMESSPAYVEPGWLIFTRDSVLAAQPFDAKRLHTTGEAVSLGDEPGIAPGSAAYDAGRRVSASLSGSLAYYLEPAANTNVEWIDQSGKVTGTVGVPAGRYTAVALAPDRARAILVRRNSGTAPSMWLADLARESAIPLSVTGGHLSAAVWSPDSTRFVYAADRDGHRELYEKTLADASPDRLMMEFLNPSAMLASWSKNEILFAMIEPGLKWNVYRLPTSGATEPVPLVRGPAIEVGGALSPDGHSLAYMSDEGGRLDVFVQSFPAVGTGQQISAGGAQRFWWTRDSRHLLYLRRDHTLWRVDVGPPSPSATARQAATTPHAGAPQQLGTFPPNLADMDFSSDDQRFLAIVPERAGVGSVTIVQGWRGAIGKR